jgi:hypothetical protein
VEVATRQASACLAISAAGAPSAPGGAFGLPNTHLWRGGVSAVDEIDADIPEIRARSR